MNFKIKILDHFSPYFILKNGNFKTRDFSPLIERVLAGVKKEVERSQILTVSCDLTLFIENMSFLNTQVPR